jgi:hypothetical protein
MNISKMVKTPEEMAKLTRVITHHMPFIKNCHLDLLCETSIPPFASEMDFVNFYRDSKLVDENLKASSIDLVFA